MTIRPRDSLLLGGLALLLGLPLALSSRSVQPARSWLGPSSTVWAGTELRGMNVWSRGGVTSNLLELRCVRQPYLRTRLDYCPGPEWHGWAEWKTGHVVYKPGWKKSTPKIPPVSLAAPWWLKFCR